MGNAPRPLPPRATRTRTRLPIHIAVRLEGQDVVRTVNTVDFSKRGLRVQTNLQLEPGQAVYAMPSGGKTPSGYCRVVWTRAHEAGLEFVN